VDELSAKQASILAGASTLLKPGGRLVYATCSVLAQENEGVVERFLAAHPQFAVLDCQQVLDESRIALESGRYLKLSPQVHDTDGFFAAVLERRG
jgi:16S rRNA (cytosine967-C5)-methyltransferase